MPAVIRREPRASAPVRLRAARLAGLDTVPAVLQDLADDRLLEVALIENIQREDLNPIETAEAFERLAQQLQLSHEEIARRTGKERSTITNTLRLLRLPPEIQLLLAERRLSMGHARALLGLADQDLQIQLANRAVAQGHSVRQVERTVSQLTTKRPEPEIKPQDPNVKAAALTNGEPLRSSIHLTIAVIRFVPESKSARSNDAMPTNCTLSQVVDTLGKRGQVNLLFFGERDLSDATNTTVRFDSTERRPAFSLDADTNHSLTNREFGLRLQICAHGSADQRLALDWMASVCLPIPASLAREANKYAV